MTRKINIAVFGAGYVGLVSAAGLAAIGHNVVCVDIDATKVSKLIAGEIPFYEPGLSELVLKCVENGSMHFTSLSKNAITHGEVLIIAVGTPPLEDGTADLSQVLSVAKTIGGQLQKYAVVVVKSTVPVGTSDLVTNEIAQVMHENSLSVDFAVVSNPEFLKEGDAVNDFMKPDRIVVGTSDQLAIEILREMYQPLCVNENTLMVMDARSSELCKYASNAMLATRISFMNEMANLADCVGADINEVRRVMAADPRIGAKYLNAGAGFGGSCFPKDLRAIAAMGDEHGCSLDLVASVISVNDAQQSVLLEKAKYSIGSLKGKRCAVWGLAFKPDTDDVREAPAVALIHSLIAEGATVVAHDPLVSWLSMYSSLPTEIFSIVDSPYAAVVGADVLFLVTEWEQFRNLDVSQLIEKMQNPLIIDGRNLWSNIDFTQTEATYIGIGRHSLIANKTSASVQLLAG